MPARAEWVRSPSSLRSIDKDGLVDYRYLRSRYPELRPGIFHDTEKDVMLFAHPYLRRSLSRLNVLNKDLLTRLAALAESEPSLTLRLRLDPDIVGYPDARTALELEFWRGPKFTDDIGKIPAGVTEHKASDHLKEFEGVDRQASSRAVEQREACRRKAAAEADPRLVDQSQAPNRGQNAILLSSIWPSTANFEAATWSRYASMACRV